MHLSCRKSIGPIQGRRLGRRDTALAACCFCLREAGSTVLKLATFAAIIVVFGLAIIERGPLPVPQVATAVEAAMAERLGPGAMTVGTATFALDGGEGVPTVALRDVVFRDGNGRTLIEAPLVRSEFSMADGLMGEMRPTRFVVEGAQVSIARGRDGHFTAVSETTDIAASPTLLAAIEEPAGLSLASMPMAEVAAVSGDFFDILDQIDAVDFNDFSIRVLDDASGRSWFAPDAALSLKDGGGGQSALLRTRIESEGRRSSEMQLSAVRDVASKTTTLTADISGVDPRDLADIVPALGAMRIVDAALDGTLSLTLDAAGQLTALSGRFRAGEGTLRTGQGPPVPFSKAETAFAFDPSLNRFDIGTLSVDTDIGHLEGQGEARVSFDADGQVDAVVWTLTLDDVAFGAGAIFNRAFVLSDGKISGRLRLDPFELDIGEATFRDGAARLRASATLRPGPEGWTIAARAEAWDLTRDQALDRWPVAFRPPVRSWFESHILSGDIPYLRADFRLKDSVPTVALGYDFTNATAMVFDTMPPLQQGRGKGRIDTTGFHLSLAAGQVHQPGRAPLDFAGSRLALTALDQPIPQGQARLVASGAIPAAMSLLAMPPLSLTAEFEDPGGFAEGQSTAAIDVTFPVKAQIAMEEVTAVASAELRGVTSTAVVPGYTVTADNLTLRADNAMLEIEGQASIADVPLDFNWSRAVDPGASGDSTLAGHFPLNNRNLLQFGIELPRGALRGTTRARLDLDIPAAGAPRYRVRADVGPLRLAVPALDWAKRAGPGGAFEVAGRLNTIPTVEKLTLEAPGMRAAGTLELTAAGLKAARFSRLRVGRWLDAPLTLYPGARTDSGRVTMAGGVIDLTHRATTTSSSDSGDYTIDFRPDRLIVSTGMALRGVRGTLKTRGGLQGQFAGQVNGGPTLSAILRPGERLMLAAKDGGATLRSAGIFEAAYGGALRVSLAPAGPPGVYAGRFALRDTRVRQAGILMEILSVASIIGMIDKLAGPGLGFSAADGSFVLTPQEVILEEARAIGPALGLTLRGVYHMGADRVNMEGVVTPLYAINGALERIPVLGRFLGGRRGEGLLGMNYRLVGNSADPTVTVNPLSILTPGAMRELFQRRTVDDAMSRALN